MRRVVSSSLLFMLTFAQPNAQDTDGREIGLCLTSVTARFDGCIQTPELQRKIAARVLDEGDLDGNSKLSRTEFMRLVYRIPDFAVYVSWFSVTCHVDFILQEIPICSPYIAIVSMARQFSSYIMSVPRW